jgi:sugar lactone lactonase YvrE
VIAEQVTDPVAAHGEGPVWDAGWAGLRWVDMLAGDVLELDHGTGRVRRTHVGPVAAALRPATDGGVVLALDRGFALADRDLRSVRPLPELWPDPGVRMNDGGCDPDGRFYCGSMAYDETPGAGALHRLDRDGGSSVVLRGVTISNGLAWSPDGATAYYVDTATQCVTAFDYSAATGLSAPRTVVRIAEEDGAPDGLTVDSSGTLWVALWGGGAVRGYSPTGTLSHVIELPVTRVTSCAFGPPDLGTLYITTSRQDVDPAAQPAAGALFAARVGAVGLPTLPYGGPTGP